MKRVLALLLVLTGCAHAPPPPVAPQSNPIVEPARVHRHVASQADPGAASPASVAAVLHDTSALADQTYSYVETRDARPANIATLTRLKRDVERADAVLLNSRHRPTAAEVANARRAADALAHFFATKDG